MPGHIQLSTRIYIAEQYFRHRCSLCLTVVTCPYDAGDVCQISKLFHLYHSHCLHHYNCIGIYGSYSFYKFILIAGQG